VKGTGLGLYIVRSIVRAHGGKVFAHSEGEGRGATFTLELPRFAGEPAALDMP
jgi:signal transduction histidine kinase